MIVISLIVLFVIIILINDYFFYKIISKNELEIKLLKMMIEKINEDNKLKLN